ncbi:endonuclease domain-containing protein [Patescibacteria group bacterium]|nr:endonuclease domain-containing protein [Patescibacteria group bacterium]
MSYKQKIFIAKKFRKNLTKSERIFWQELRNKKFLNLKFRRQFVVFGYILDFYCPKLKVAIEVDGKIHERQKGKDTLRQQIIERKQIKFFRITSDEIEFNLNQSLKKLEKFLLSTSPSLTIVERGNRGGEDT